jgi:hypothetical protein
MTNETFSLDGYDARVTTRQVETGDWTSDISVTRGGQAVRLPQVEPVGPNWRTEDEALRAGVEQARRLIDRYLRGHDNQHTSDETGRRSRSVPE